jgi:hypothetical protein
MTTEVLYKKTSRYLKGQSFPAETRQIQNWLSCTGEQGGTISPEKKAEIEMEILADIQAHTAYPLFYPKVEAWWKKITAFF